MRVTAEYRNPNNGGKEFVSRQGDRFFIRSVCGEHDYGTHEVSRTQLEICLRHSGAPEEIYEFCNLEAKSLAYKA